MSDKIENPSAFPVVVAGDEKAGWLPEVVQEGMDLRDYFAAKALPIIMENYAVITTVKNIDTDIELKLSQRAYKYADAMLKARLNPINTQP